MRTWHHLSRAPFCTDYVTPRTEQIGLARSVSPPKEYYHGYNRDVNDDFDFLIDQGRAAWQQSQLLLQDYVF